MLDLQQCGSAGFFMTFLGVAGFAASLFAIVLAILDPRVSGNAMLGRVATIFGPATALVGLLAMGVGTITTARGRHTVDAIVAAERLSAADAERMRDLGYAQVKTCTMLGFQSGAMPLVAGLVATGIAVARRRSAPRPAG